MAFSAAGQGLSGHYGRAGLLVGINLVASILRGFRGGPDRFAADALDDQIPDFRVICFHRLRTTMRPTCSAADHRDAFQRKPMSHLEADELPNTGDP
jgi:hypothetical protein